MSVMNLSAPSNSARAVEDILHDLDLRGLFSDLTRAPGATEVATSAFIRAVIDRYRVTFEAAREVLYQLVETGRAVITLNYNLRLT